MSVSFDCKGDVDRVKELFCFLLFDVRSAVSDRDRYLDECYKITSGMDCPGDELMFRSGFSAVFELYRSASADYASRCIELAEFILANTDSICFQECQSSGMQDETPDYDDEQWKK